MILRRTDSRDPEFRTLVAALDAELDERYGEIQKAYSPHNVFTTETALVASVDGVPVGCGCFKPYDAETVELKRMFVARTHRGAGVGRALVGELEAWARELGYRAVVLETGDRQPDAVALYERAGYARTPLYGPYVHLNNSICMRKSVA